MIDPADNINLVHHVAKWFGFEEPSADYDDLVGDGMVGLVQAAQRWTPGVDWPRYATGRIKTAMIDGLRRRVPRAAYKRGVKVVPLDGHDFPAADDPAVTVAESEAIAALQARIDSTVRDEKDRRLIEHLLAGTMGKDIAAEFGVSQSAISQRKQRIRDLLAAA